MDKVGEDMFCAELKPCKVLLEKWKSGDELSFPPAFAIILKEGKGIIYVLLYLDKVGEDMFCAELTLKNLVKCYWRNGKVETN